MSALAHRLPTSIQPIAYDVDITTSPEDPGFTGKAIISLDVLEDADAVEMHARDLELTGATIDGEDVSVATDAERQTVRFTPKDKLTPGKRTLEVAFAGQLSTSMHGVYLATDGRSKAVCTQCEATDARAIFPCFDEPDFKARIRWTIRAPKHLLALSNGALVDAATEGDHKVWQFEATEPVSSYLAALAIGDFEGTEAKVVRGTPLRVYASTGKLAQTAFALDYTAGLLPWYEDYFDIPYPFGKYDQVAVPGFDAGAMENVGLVLFRQNLLLMDPDTASWRQEKLIAKVIAHEFAHMWFGNLVTMKWWDDLWLNEAFAEWMAHKACDALTPDYRVWDDFQDDKNRALVDDALPTTHPIWTAVQTPDQAIEMFDVITYQKGCAVMRMLENFLGEGPFREGLRAYMKQFARDNAAGPDLWRALSEASGQPVGELMDSWIMVAGFPVLSCALDGHTLRLSQRRFFSSSAVSEEAPRVWSVPVVVRYADDEGVKEHRFIMTEAEHRETLPAAGQVAWCYPNANEIGFYRCQPDDGLRHQLLGALDALGPTEQMGFIEDQWALVRNGSNDIGGFVEVIEAYAKSSAINNHNVLRAVVDRMGTIDHLLEDGGDEAARANARQWVAGLLTEGLEALGYEPKDGESQNDVQRRGLFVHGVAKLAKVDHAIAAAEERAERERNDPKSVDPNLAGTFLNVAATAGDAARYGLWVQTYEARKSSNAPPQTTLRYLYTLSSFRDEALTDRTLGLIDAETIPQEAVGPVLSQLLGQRHAQQHAWRYLKANWKTLRARVGDMGISRVVEAVGAMKPTDRADIVAFFEENPPSGAERALARALENIDQLGELRTRVTAGLLQRFG